MISWPALEAVWCAETSADPAGWTSTNPAWGQCAVTALLVQDYLGGGLLRCINEGGSHYWNQLDWGIEVDFTRSQFSVWKPTEIEPRTRDYVMDNPSTRNRYLVLRSRVEGWQEMLVRRSD
jgi:hypothetical protein